MAHLTCENRRYDKYDADCDLPGVLWVAVDGKGRDTEGHKGQRDVVLEVLAMGCCSCCVDRV